MTYVRRKLRARYHHHEWDVCFVPRSILVGFQWKRYPCAIEIQFFPVPMLGILFYLQWQPHP